MLKINGTDVKSPSAFTWGLSDVSSENAGRTQDALMHKDRIAQKRKLECSWNNLSKEDAAVLLQVVNQDIYLQVTYYDAMSGKDETRTFYVGDRSAPVKMWNVNGKIYSSIAFNFIER